VEHRQLKFFVAVAEELHFTRASVRLRIAQPHLSQEIRRLEREIGVELFKRTKRSVALTPAGHIFLRHVRLVLDGTVEAVHSAQRASRGEIGRIRVGFVSVAAIYVIPKAIARFRSAYPDVEVLLKEVSSDEGLEAVRIGQLDLCLLHPPRTPDAAVDIETIWSEPMVVALPPKHPLAEMKRIGLQRLKQDTWVIPQREIASRLHDEVIAACTIAGFEPRVAQRTTRMTTTISMVASGIGVALLPITAARLGIGGAVYRNLRPPPRTSIPVAFAWRQSQTSPALTNLMAIVRDSAGSQDQRLGGGDRHDADVPPRPR
jgi:DNA-binding transcriptional LysR family regulator